MIFLNVTVRAFTSINLTWNVSLKIVTFVVKLSANKQLKFEIGTLQRLPAIHCIPLLLQISSSGTIHPSIWLDVMNTIFNLVVVVVAFSCQMHIVPSWTCHPVSGPGNVQGLQGSSSKTDDTRLWSFQTVSSMCELSLLHSRESVS